jgi:hypothetical protein
LRNSPVALAAVNGCAEVARLLLPLMKDIQRRNIRGDSREDESDESEHGSNGVKFPPLPPADYMTRRYAVCEEYLGTKSNRVLKSLRDSIKIGAANLDICNQLLSLGEFDDIKKLANMGVK